MRVKWVVVVFLFLKPGQAEESSFHNVSCCTKNNHGFKFKHFCPNATEIEVSDQNGTMMAYAVLNKPPPDTPLQGITIDHDSFTTYDCQGPLTFKCITSYKSFIKEMYEHVQFIEQCGGDETTGFGVPEISFLSIFICIIICICPVSIWFCWKKIHENQSERSTSNIELESVSSEDAPPQQRFQNGFRNQGDDPGGTHGSERTDSHREGVRECPAPGQEAEDGQSEGQPLLSDPRAAGQDFEMMGEAEDSVNEQGTDPVSVLASRWPEPKSDVESTYHKRN